MVLIVLALGLFLLGAAAFAVDMGNLWFHRQSAQNAADAACMAGAMDILVKASGASTGHQGFTIGTAFDCSSNGTAVPCKYAAYNGYDGKNTTPGNQVYVSFPGAASVTGVPSAAVPPTTFVPNAFMRVDVLDHVQTYFLGLLNGTRTQDVRSFAVCGTVLATAPVPLVVLNPTQSSSLQGNGNPTLKILGGPRKSVQVNSGSGTAVGFGGTIDLSHGGPNYNGSQLGTFGGPPTPTGTFLPSSTYWIDHSAPVADPFQNVAAPVCTAVSCPITVPSDMVGKCTAADIGAGNCMVDYHSTVGGVGTAHGCPDPGGCVLYSAGFYNGGITVKNSTAIFDPGVYYLDGGLGLMANSMVRPSTFTPPAPNNIGGTMFYLTSDKANPAPKCSGQTGLVCVGSNSGKAGLDPFSITAAQCPGGAAIDPALLAILPPGATTLTGNMLLAPCTGPYGDPLGTGQYRGILFFGDRSSSDGGGWGGGGGFLLAGSMYFHQCNAAGTGIGCGAPPTDYNANFGFQGNSGSTSYVLGEIIADTMSAGGTPTIAMVLNPNKTNSILKATLVPWSNTSN